MVVSEKSLTGEVATKDANLLHHMAEYKHSCCSQSHKMSQKCLRVPTVPVSGIVSSHSKCFDNVVLQELVSSRENSKGQGVGTGNRSMTSTDVRLWDEGASAA